MSDPERGAGDVEGGGSIDAGELATWRRQQKPFTVLDVRDRDEFEQWHVSGPSVEAVHTPHQRFIAARVQGTTEELVPDGPEPVVVVCGVGEASAEVADQLREVGVDARNLDDGMEAWARQYDAVELPCSIGTVIQYSRPSSGCLAYLVVAPESDDVDEPRPAAVVDPLRAFADRYAEDAAELDSASPASQARQDAADLDATLDYAVDTHVHADHVSGVRAVADATGAEIVLPTGAADRGLDYEGYDPTFVEDGDELRLGDSIALEVLALPGHTREMTGYRLADEEYGDLLFGGDTLFLRSVARPDLAAEGEREVASMARLLHGTLADLRSLLEETRLAPGHVSDSTSPDERGRYLATLGELRERLDLLALDEDAFVDRLTASLPPRPANDEEIRAINLGARAVEEETAFELELGPNNCAAE